MLKVDDSILFNKKKPIILEGERDPQLIWAKQHIKMNHVFYFIIVMHMQVIGTICVA